MFEVLLCGFDEVLLFDELDNYFDVFIKCWFEE